jgi:DNA-binding CsgD family transcriptional regulator
MKAAARTTQQQYGRLKRKTFGASLSAELQKQVPALGELTAARLAEHLEKMFHDHFPPTERIGMGQMLWPAVAKEETGAYGKRIQDTKLKPVVVNVVNDQDFRDMIYGVPRSQIRRKIAIRLFDEAYSQGGVFTEVDVAAILGVSPLTVSQYVTQFEKKADRLVPRRGTIHDMGPSITHKRQICYRVIILGRSIEQTARETDHSPESVTRYVQDYRRVAHCLAAGFSISETAFATKLSPGLVGEYAELQQNIESNESEPLQ